MDADKTTIANLQDACAQLSSLKEQYRVDAVWVHSEYDMDWLKHRIKKWYSGAECHLGRFIKRLDYYGVQPTYATAKVQTNDSLDGMLARQEKMVYDALEAFENYRNAALEAKAGATTDDFEHAIQELEYDAIKIERERRLIAKLGEPGYIGARLEDG